jgi:hypothetical protein
VGGEAEADFEAVRSGQRHGGAEGVGEVVVADGRNRPVAPAG